MSLSFATNIVAAYFTSNIANDPNYESPGNYNIPNVLSGTVGIVSVNITAAGTYVTGVPTATPSSGAATFTTEVKFLSSASIAAAGTVYAPGDTVHLVGGTETTPVALTVATVKLVSATLGSSGGTGYADSSTFNVTVAGGTETSAAVVSVSTNSSGVVTTINSVGTAGSYTVLPTLTNNLATGGTGTGLELNLVFGVNTYTISNAGVYTAIPANPISTTTSGSGTGLTFTGSWGVTALVITNPGQYSGSAPTIAFSTGAAAATATLGSSSTSSNDQQKIMCLIEIMRAFIAEADSPQQLSDMHDIMRKMLAYARAGTNTSSSGNTNNFDPTELSANALNSAMNYFANSPKRLNLSFSGVPRGMTL